jgi:hypothetical protein
VLAIVENQFETPVGRQENWCIGTQVRNVRIRVAIVNMLYIASRRAGCVTAIALVRLRLIDPIRILGLVLVGNNVPLVVVTLTDEPTKDSPGIGGVSDSTVGSLAVPGCDIVFRDGTPKGILRVRQVHPTLNTGEQSFDSRTITISTVLLAINRSW